MCTSVKMEIRGCSNFMPRSLWIPCGQCEECRNALRSQWSFRFRYEFEYLQKLGWKVAFFTLTYKESKLPYIPVELEKNENPFNCPPCFSREDCKRFITLVRHRLYDKYNVGRKNKDKGYIVEPLRWGLFCEYGEDTKRPHYHGLFCFPPVVPDEFMFSLLGDCWRDKNGDSLGFHFPKDIRGGLDSHGYEHKPFIVRSVGSAAMYAAKYCCKDLSFFESFNRDDFRYSSGNLCIRNYLPFHMQSRSIGLAFLNNLTDEQKIDYLKNGVSFVGSNRLLSLPVYICNKILYDNKYLYDIHTRRRFCRREASDFLKDNYKRIFDIKCCQLEDKLKTITSMQTYINNREVYDDVQSFIDGFLRLGKLRDLSSCLVAYYGIHGDRINLNVPRSDFWLLRYLNEYNDCSFNCVPPCSNDGRLSDSDKSFLGSLFYFYDNILLLYSAMRQEEQSNLLNKSRQVQRIRETRNHGE